MIAESLDALRVPIDSVQPHPRNARSGDVGAISESLRRFGQQKPIVVQKSTGYVVAGNHLWKAAKALDWEDIAANIVDMSDRDASAFQEADNRTADLGMYDETLHAEILQQLAEQGNLEGTGWDGDDIDALIAEMNARNRRGLTDPDEVPEAPEEPVTKPGDLWILGERVRCPKCHRYSNVAR